MNLPYRRGWRTNGWAAGAASAFASCRHVAAHALGSNGPLPDLPTAATKVQMRRTELGIAGATLGCL
jgi:hypothetical protein